MFRITTQDFTELELAPGTEIRFEFESPVFNDDHIGAVFSTQIAFPPSPANRQVFGYVPTLFLAPSVRKVEGVTLWVGGSPVLSGDLHYDGIEDGNLQYTFTTRHPDLEQKIWERPLLPFDARTLPSDRGLFITPLLVDKDKITMHAYSAGLNVPQTQSGDSPWRKYFNYRNTGQSYRPDRFIPAVNVSRILAGIGIGINSEYATDFNSTCILGLFHEFGIGDLRIRTGSRSGTGVRVVPGAVIDSSRQTDIAAMLPDITFGELLKNVCGIFCLSCFQEDGLLRLYTFSEIAENVDYPQVWDGKVSDIFSSETVEARGYRFGFAREEDSAPDGKLESARANGQVVTVDSTSLGPGAVLAQFNSEAEYKAVFDQSCGHLYSGKLYHAPTGEAAYECDILFHNALPVGPEGSDGVFDNSSDFLLVRRVPEKVFNGDGSASTVYAPVIEPSAISAGRGKRVYLCCRGPYFSDEVDDMITPAWLWPGYHKQFADWLGRDRQSISAGLDLSPQELAGFRMHRPVYFSGRRWLVRRLCVTVRTGSDAIATEGDLVEL